MRISDWSSDVCSSDLVSAQTVVELAKAVAKALLVGGVAVAVIGGHRDDMLALMHAAPTEALVQALTLVALCAALIVASLGIIVLLDVPWQIWSHLKKLRMRSEEHTSELQSLMRISYAVFCLKKK